MNDPLDELKAAQQKAMTANPSWATDGSAERPSGPPQLPLPMPREAKLQMQVPPKAAGAGGGGGDGGLGTITVALAVRRAEGVFESQVAIIPGTLTNEEV